MYKRVADLYTALFGFRNLFLAKGSLIKHVVEETRPSPLARALYLVSSIIERRVVEQLNSLIREAERMHLFERFYDLESSWEVRGSIVWQLSMQRLARFEPPLQRVMVRDPRSPENMLLVAALRLAKSIINEAEALINAFSNTVSNMLNTVFDTGSRRVLLLSVVEDLRECIERFKQRIDELQRRPLLRAVSASMKRPCRLVKTLRREIERRMWVPRWVKELLKLIDTITEIRRELEELKTVILHRGGSEMKTLSAVIRYWAWRLYELYVALLILDTLKSLGAEIVGRDLRRVLVVFRNSVFSIYLGSQLSNSRISRAEARWLENGEVPRDVLEKCRGRPDIAMVSARPLLVVEAKFSRSPSYLSAARFKIMAYAYEYEPYAAILAFPGVSSRVIAVDREDEETIELLREAEKRNGIVMDLRNGSKLCVVPITPSREREQRAGEALRKVLSMVLQAG